MNQEDTLHQYAMLLKAQSEAEIALKLFEMRVNLESSNQSCQDDSLKNQRKLEAFALLHRDELESSEIELLKTYYQPISAIENYLSMSRSSAQRWLQKNDIVGIKAEGVRVKLYPSIEIVKAIHGEPDYKIERRIHTLGPVPRCSPISQTLVDIDELNPRDDNGE